VADPGSTPIIRIPLDSAEFDEFTDKFMRYQKKLEEQPQAWAGTNKGIKNTKSEFDAMGKAFSNVVKASIDPKFGRTFDTFKKTSKESEKSWEKISKDIRASAKEMESLSRMASGFGGLVKGLGIAGLAIGGLASIYNMVRDAASGVAAQNKSSKSLGLDLGKETAFTTYGKSLGLDREDLEAAENAKQDPTLRTPFVTAGLTQDQIANEPADELAWDFARAKAKMFSQWEKTNPGTALNQAQAFGWQDSPDQLRLLAKNYDQGLFDKQRSQYEENWKQMGVDQASADKATAFDTHQEANWQKIETSWHSDILLLTPHLDRWSDAATHLTEKFLKTTADTINRVANAGDHPTPPGTEPPPADGTLAGNMTHDLAVSGQWLRSHIPALTDVFNDKDAAKAAAQGFTLDPNKTAHMAALERAGGMPVGILGATEMNESSGGVNNTNPKNPNVLGSFQFDAPTAQQYGVNRYDEYSSEVGAAHKLYDLHKKYGAWDKAVAAYDGFAGLDKDIAKYGDNWKDHIAEFQKSGETEQYLRKLAWQGVDLSKGQAAGGPFTETGAAKAAMLDPGESVINGKPGTIDGFQMVPYDDKAPDTAAQADDKGTIAQYLDRLHDGFADIGNALREGGGSQFAMPPASRPTNNNQQAPVQVSLNITQPAGSNTNVSMGGIPS